MALLARRGETNICLDIRRYHLHYLFVPYLATYRSSIRKQPTLQQIHNLHPARDRTASSFPAPGLDPSRTYHVFGLSVCHHIRRAYRSILSHIKQYQASQEGGCPPSLSSPKSHLDRLCFLFAFFTCQHLLGRPKPETKETSSTVVD